MWRSRPFLLSSFRDLVSDAKPFLCFHEFGDAVRYEKVVTV